MLTAVPCRAGLVLVLQVSQELYAVAEADLIDGRMLLLAAGKKNKMLVRIEA